MDFKRSPGHVSTHASNNVSGVGRIRSFHELDWAAKKLADRNIKQNALQWYAWRVESFLKTIPEKSLSDITPADVKKFPTIRDSKLRDEGLANPASH